MPYGQIVGIRGNDTRHRIVWSSAAAVLAAALLAGCAGLEATAPTGGATSSSSGSADPTPTPSPGATDAAAQGISTTCDDLLAAPSLSEATGSAGAAESDGLWATAAEVAGGIECAFTSDELSGTIVALPTERASSIAAAEAGCAPSYDAIECVGTGSADGMSVAVSFLATEQTQTATDTVVRLRDAALDAVGAVQRIPLDASPAAAPSCADLADAIDPSRVLGADDVFPEPITEGDVPFDRRIVEAAELVRACDWSELTDFRELSVVIVPGGADRWDEVSERFGGTPASIDGTDAAEVQEDNRVRILVRGTADLILVEGRFGDPETALSTEDLRPVAREVLALS